MTSARHSIQKNMKTILLALILLPFFVTAQKTITLDPEQDPIARRSPNGSLELAVPPRVLIASLEATIPDMVVGIDTFELIKMGKSNYLIARSNNKTTTMRTVMAFLLQETTPNQFLADGLFLSCSGSGECRECSFPATCSCLKGAGGCILSATMAIKLHKVSVSVPN
jgi:hypothetical protein